MSKFIVLNFDSLRALVLIQDSIEHYRDTQQKNEPYFWLLDHVNR